MSDLQIRTDLLEQLTTDLDAIAKEFDKADEFSDEVAHAVGHEELSGKVEDFAHKWNDKRKEMTEAVKALQQQIQAISDAFTEADNELSKALEEAASETATTNPDAAPGSRTPSTPDAV
ncbi:uncharacterized protein YukE [Okibacterium sp. HSC-33S16]|uniref:hypothetical protein n=1 Tax=Okibacterium sp. HSC-33S16 TaxID=2910965 RepID=UPI00209FF193|nr:hypothetical protein [Okibacterium sp. HSC-33S16]MCP2029982.1 uncharacterized protein YukE [Okibacterium sp. HSC-33S16]